MFKKKTPDIIHFTVDKLMFGSYITIETIDISGPQLDVWKTVEAFFRLADTYIEANKGGTHGGM